MIKPGTIIADRYSIVRLIGEGGMGSVYEARHIQIGKRVAIKFLAKEFSQDAEAIERFQQEAQIAGAIGHINICEVMDIGVTDDGLTFLIMEYLQGESLAHILLREKQLTVDISLGILDQILDALEEVHGRGIVHRDLKPDNVFITTVKGHGLVVKLLDFGISKVVKPGADSMRLTKTGTMIGTPYYMSPEQIRVSKEVDHRTDIYSCGVILYEMLTGCIPYGGTNFSEVMAHILEDPFPDPGAAAAHLPPGVVELLKRSMEKAASKRIESASKFKEEINKISTEIGLVKSVTLPSTNMASMVGIPGAATRVTKGMKIAAVFGGILVLTLMAVGIVLLVLHGGGKKAGDTDSPRAGNETKVAKSPSPSAMNSGSDSGTGMVQKQQKVRIVLSDTPPGVRILLGDSVITGNVLETTKSDEQIAFTVSAEGYEPREVKVVPSGDITVDGKLKPAVAGKAKKEPGTKKAKTTGTKPVEPDAKVKESPEKKSKGMDLDWESYPGPK